MLVYLTGYMGSGKTFTGKELAKRLDYTFLDMDAMIERVTKKTIAQLFGEGVSGFRETERSVLEETFSKKNCVIATGGGTPCFFDNMERMNAAGITVFLDADAGTLYARLSKEKETRPLISGMPDVDLMERILLHLGERRHYYGRAKIRLKVHKSEEENTAEKILQLLKNQER